MQSALLMLPQSVFNLVFAPIVGHWFDRVGLKPLVTTGLFGSIIAMLLLAQGTRAALIPCFVASMIIMGIGAAFNQQYNTHLMQVAPREMSGRVMSLSTSAQRGFSSCAIAVFQALLHLVLQRLRVKECRKRWQALWLIVIAFTCLLFCLGLQSLQVVLYRDRS